MPFTIRTARPDDVDTIASWTRETFSWGDYVADSLPEWLEAPNTQLFVVADENDLPRGVSRVQMLSPAEGWLSAARVHPDSRRKGLGTMLNRVSVGWIRSQGGLVARLAIEEDNTAARNQVLALGYHQTSVWIFGSMMIGEGARVDRGDRLSVVGRSDVDPAWMYWSTSEISEAGRALVPSGWQWRRATVEDLDRAAGERRLLSNAAGWIVIEEVVANEVDVVWVAASQNDFPRLVNGMRHLAMERRLERVVYRIPQSGWSGEALAREGVDVSEVLVFSKPVTQL